MLECNFEWQPDGCERGKHTTPFEAQWNILTLNLKKIGGGGISLFI